MLLRTTDALRYRHQGFHCVCEPRCDPPRLSWLRSSVQTLTVKVEDGTLLHVGVTGVGQDVLVLTGGPGCVQYLESATRSHPAGSVPGIRSHAASADRKAAHIR